MKRPTTLLLCALFLIPALAFSSTPVGTQAGNTETSLSASDVTASTRLIVRRVESDPDRVYLYDPEAEETHVVVISEKTRLSARRKKDFDGRRKLGFGDLAMGQTLKITFRLDDGRITSIQVVDVAS